MIYRIFLSTPARRALTKELPEPVAAACFEFIHGALAENPYRVGKPLRPPAVNRYAARRGSFRLIYTIGEHELVVEVVSIRHRRDVYRNLN